MFSWVDEVAKAIREREDRWRDLLLGATMYGGSDRRTGTAGVVYPPCSRDTHEEGTSATLRKLGTVIGIRSRWGDLCPVFLAESLCACSRIGLVFHLLPKPSWHVRRRV